MEQINFKPPKPDNYLVWAILTTCFCCLPFGIVSIVESSKVDTLYYQGLYQEAENKSQSAKTWALVSAVSDFAIFIIYFLFIFFFVGFGYFTSKF